MTKDGNYRAGLHDAPPWTQPPSTIPDDDSLFHAPIWADPLAWVFWAICATTGWLVGLTIGGGL